jgi:cytochrome c6
MKLNNSVIAVLVLAFGIVPGFISPVAAQDGAATYKAKCVSCHAADGSGSAVGKKLGAHDFRAADVQKMSDAELSELITKGKNKMPAYEKSLKADEIQGLVAFIRTLAAK